MIKAIGLVILSSGLLFAIWLHDKTLTYIMLAFVSGYVALLIKDKG